ncbi:phospholipase A1 member A-like [Culex pipiens pallens]|uniref:phospholipase A1 member A-like n=1 Tax=Culex pipiens pallens TaxID=42434 RepID=UPI0019532701|nr:phospholipase A1 member A-like [Culex pipiens pallens]
MFPGKATLLLLFVAASTVQGGLLDLFNTTSDNNLAQVMDTIFEMSRNEFGSLIDGRSNIPVEVEVTFWCGNGASPTLKQTYLYDQDLASKVDVSKPIVIITHGWTDNVNKTWVQETAKNVIKYQGSNVCAVDWNHLAKYRYYVSAIENVPKVSGYVTLFVAFLRDSGIPLDRVTLVGHSLGAQISGQVGYNYRGQIGAIFGLDPAGPLFTAPTDRGLAYRLDASDAKYVQMILTSRGQCGVMTGDGHENFYPNGGFSPQTNCIVPLTSDAEFADQSVCSHLHATELFKFSLVPTIVFKSTKCDDLVSYLGNLCILNRTNRLGAASDRSGGNFYLITSPFSPYNV